MSTADQPRRIGRYEVVRAIGEGGMAQVWLAKDPALGRDVAIKVVKVAGLPESVRATFVERFKNEARAVAMLRHASIVAVHDTGVDEELGVYSVYEFVSGPSLRERLDQVGGPLPREEAARILQAVGEALSVAHDAGIVHRDVKPANILLADDGNVKLADFGVARLPDAAMTREGTFLGTPSYAAPEALTKGTFGPASDVWAFGVVAYETLCGRHPFPGDDVHAVSNRVLHGTIEPPVRVRPEVGRAVSDATLRALERDPDKRAASAAEVGRSIASGLQAGPGAASSRAGSMRRAIGVGALVVAIVAGGVATRAVLNAQSDAAAQSDASLSGAPDDGGSAGSSRRIPPVTPVPPPPLATDAGRAAEPTAEPDAGPAAPLDLRSEEDRIKELMARAHRLEDAGDLTGARTAAEQVLRIDPGHPEARAILDRL